MSFSNLALVKGYEARLSRITRKCNVQVLAHQEGVKTSRPQQERVDVRSVFFPSGCDWAGDENLKLMAHAKATLPVAFGPDQVWINSSEELRAAVLYSGTTHFTSTELLHDLYTMLVLDQLIPKMRL